MLAFVGLGLYDERSITVEGRETIGQADRVFLERYTGQLVGATVDDLETYHGVEITVCDRDVVEGDPAPILAAAESGGAAFLVAGDPMISTTHVDLRLRAHDRGIETRLVHGTTAQAAACGLTGLQNYRFGKATTVPFPEQHGGHGVPRSVVETLEGNVERGLHTLLYLDIEAERGAYLTVDRAAAMLADHGDRLGVAIARAGGPAPVVRADRLAALVDVDFGGPLHLLVIPGDLHPMEADALRAFAGATDVILDG